MMIDNQSSFIMQESENNDNETAKNYFTHELKQEEIKTMTH